MISEQLAHEVSRNLEVVEREIITPNTGMMGSRLKDTIGFVPILRAALGMEEAFHNVFPWAQVMHLGLARNEETLKPSVYLNKLPAKIDVTLCYLLDPMLATGGSAVEAVKLLKNHGAEQIVFVGLIGAPEGVQALQETYPDVEIHLAALDDHLDERGYIIPGLGDAGDRQFGT